MGKLKVLCVFTTVLGNQRNAEWITLALNRMVHVEATFVLLGNEDYAKYRAPPWTRAVNAWHAQSIARRKVRLVGHQKFDLLMVNSWEFVTAFRRIARHTPAVAVMDSVPATVDRQLRSQGQRGWKRWVGHHLNHGPFQKAVRDFEFFLPMASDCANALQQEYGVKREVCSVILNPQDLEQWTPGQRKYLAPPLRLLFVANDFARKGGDFLLHLYSQHLSEFCTLTIASNDSSLDKLSLPAGVQWVRGRDREQLLDEYRASDVFVFPTRQDYLPQVLTEAMAAGVPCIANDVGGIRDLVRAGETGYLMSKDDPAERWAERLRLLSANPQELARLSRNARAFAEQHLSFGRFEKLLAEVIDRITRNQTLLRS